MPKEYLEAVSQPDQTVNPLFAFLGMEVESIEPDTATLRLPFKKELIQGAGLVAGGILATLLDETMAHAVLGGNAPGQRTTTVEMSVSYLRPVANGDDLICSAKVVKRGRRVIFVEAEIRAGNRECARATGTFLPV